MKLIYIAGYGRSGSTLLESLICSYAVENIIGLGEIRYCFHAGHSRNRCTCGADRETCKVWSSKDFNASITLLNKSIGSVNIGGVRKALSEIQSNLECTAILDSSKTAFGAFFRPYIIRLATRDVTVVHLERDLQAVTDSLVNRGLNRDLMHGRKPRTRHPLWIKFAWFIANMSPLLFKMIWPSSYLKLTYDNLINQPGISLTQVADHSGIHFHAVKNEYIVSNLHSLSGNRMATSQKIKIGNGS